MKLIQILTASTLLTLHSFSNLLHANTGNCGTDTFACPTEVIRQSVDQAAAAEADLTWLWTSETVMASVAAAETAETEHPFHWDVYTAKYAEMQTIRTAVDKAIAAEEVQTVCAETRATAQAEIEVVHVSTRAESGAHALLKNTFSIIGGGNHSVRPGSGFLMQINASGSVPSTLDVVTSSGKVIRTVDLNLKKGVNTLRIRVKDVQKGLYFLRIHSEGKTEMRPFSVK